MQLNDFQQDQIIEVAFRKRAANDRVMISPDLGLMRINKILKCVMDERYQSEYTSLFRSCRETIDICQHLCNVIHHDAFTMPWSWLAPSSAFLPFGISTDACF